LINLYHMQKEKERCLAILHHINEKNKLLALQIRRLKEDRKYFESIARRQLGLVKDNEIVYRFRKELPDSAKGRQKK
jgi:cell division protein FtsB